MRHALQRSAETILKGVRRNKARILVGSDAIAIDALVRLMPSNYFRVVGPVMDRMTS